LINLCVRCSVRFMHWQESPVTIWNITRVHNVEVRPFMYRLATSLSTSFSCDSLNEFTMLTYPSICMIGSHVSPVLSYPLQKTL
jgi:hypothetical protein